MDLARARLLYVITSSGIGGSEKILADLALAQRPRWEAVAVCSLKPPGAVARDLERRGIEIFTCGLGESTGAAGLLDTLRVLPRLGRAVRRFRPTLVHAFLFRAGLLIRLPVVLRRVPRLVVSIRQMNRRAAPLHLVDRLTAGTVDRFTAVSRAARDLALARSRLAPERVEVIPNGVAIPGPGGAGTPEAAREGTTGGEAVSAWRRERRLRARRRLEASIGPIPDGRVLVGSVGRLHAVKGHAVLLGAMAWLVDRASTQDAARYGVVVVGDGDERAALEARAARPPLAGRAWLLGERDDAAEILPAFDLFVLPSRTEGMSNALLEAMAEAIPVIATQAGGSPEVVEHGLSGLLVQPGDPAALGAAIGALAGDPDRARALAFAGRERVRARFSRDAMLRAYESLYRDLLRPL
jgi:glycosyltransferase involved in cell wall biosynthesis